MRNKTIKHMHFILFLLAFSTAKLAPAAPLSRDDLSRQIDRLMAKYDHPDSPGASVAIYREQTVYLYKNYGLRDLESPASVTSETNFRTASLTKAFTATAIMQLVENDQLSLDQNLKNIFPGFANYGKKVKVKHLLSHTSGLRDYEDLMPPNYPGQITDAGVLDIIAKERSTYFNPGSEFRYSNTGYAVLAEIVTKLLGINFHEYLDQNIFTPPWHDGKRRFRKWPKHGIRSGLRLLNKKWGLPAHRSKPNQRSTG